MNEEMQEIFSKLDEKTQEVLILLAKGMLFSQNEKEGQNFYKDSDSI